MDGGGIAGYVEGATIRNCINSGAISGIFACGGIVGKGASSFEYGYTVENCGNTGNISISSTDSTKKNRVGGIAAAGVSANSNWAPVIKCCFNSGTISNCDGSGKGFGIYGYDSMGAGSMTNCYWYSGSCAKGMNSSSDPSASYASGSTVLSGMNTLYTSDSTTYKRWKVSGNGFTFQ